MTKLTKEDLLKMSIEIVKSKDIDHSRIKTTIKEAYESLMEIYPPKEILIPAVSIEESVTDNYIICLEDGEPFQMLKRHLKSHYNMTPEQYRRRWNLPESYPMVAKNYSNKRSEISKKYQFGQKK